MIELTIDAIRSWRRCITKETSAESKTINVTDPTVSQECTIPQRTKHAVIAERQHPADVLKKLKLARPAELEQGCLRASLGNRQENECKGHYKNDADDDQREHRSKYEK